MSAAVLRRAVGRASLVALSVALAAGCGKTPPAPPPPPPGIAYDTGGMPYRPLPAGGPRPDIVLVVIDTLRADMLDLAAADGGPMPRLAARARRATVFRQASTPAPWTMPAITSLLTGRLPSGHGVGGDDTAVSGLAPLATWAEILGSALGYRTEAWVGGPWTSAQGQMLEGFQRVVPNQGFAGMAPRVQRLADERRQDRRPLFLLLHGFEAHDPYGAENHPTTPPPPPAPSAEPDLVDALGPDPAPSELVRRSILDRAFKAALWRNFRHAQAQEAALRYEWSGLRDDPRPGLAEELRAKYVEGVTWTDGLVAGLLDALATSGAAPAPLTIVTGDHGEAFGEHGMLLHGRMLYDELLRVPLVVAGPKPFDTARVVDASVSLLDLLPTVLDLLGAPPPGDGEGVSLLPLLGGEGAGRAVASEERRTRHRTAGQSEALLRGLRSARWKAILTKDLAGGARVEEAYDLASDPGERTNLADAQGSLSAVPFDEPFRRALDALRRRLE